MRVYDMVLCKFWRQFDKSKNLELKQSLINPHILSTLTWDFLWVVANGSDLLYRENGILIFIGCETTHVRLGHGRLIFLTSIIINQKIDKERTSISHLYWTLFTCRFLFMKDNENSFSSWKVGVSILSCCLTVLILSN